MVKWDTPNGEMGHPKWRNGTSQMVKWDTPNGQMGYPKRQNGIPQKAKWDIPNGVLGYEKTGFRASEQGYRGGVLGVEG